jgi:hypothetical protein
MKIIFCILTEKIHRIVFDTIFIYGHKLILRDKLYLILYNTLFIFFSDFRKELVHKKPLLIRAYKQQRLSIFGYFVYTKIKRINTIRYNGT